MDIGNNCVCCNKDTSFGSGRFVNRIPADAEYESLDEKGHVIFAENEYRDGYLCESCQEIECDKCSKRTADFSVGREIDGKYYDIICSDCYDWEKEHELRLEEQD